MNVKHYQILRVDTVKGITLKFGNAYYSIDNALRDLNSLRAQILKMRKDNRYIYRMDIV